MPYTLIADAAAGALLATGTHRRRAGRGGPGRCQRRHGQQDRDVSAGLAAARHGVPFFVCAPMSSVDLEPPDGSAIPIEERAASEVLEFGGVRAAPPGAKVWNPSSTSRRPRSSRRSSPRRACSRPRSVHRSPQHSRHGARGRVWPTAWPRRGPPRHPTSPPRGRADGDRRARPAWIGRRPPTTVGRPAAARLPRARPAVRRLRDLRPRRPRVRAGRAGASRSTATQPVALALEYGGLSPQPLFVMGDTTASPRSCATSSGRAPPTCGCPPTPCRPSRPHYRVDPGPPMVRMWVDRATFQPVPGRRPPAAPGRGRRPEPALPAGLRRPGCPSVADRRGRLLRDPRRRAPRRGGRDPRRQPAGPARRRRQRHDPRPSTAAGATRRPRPAPSPPSCCGSATRSSSTSAPTTRPRSPPIARLGYAEHVRFEERLVHRLELRRGRGSPARSAASSSSSKENPSR